MTNLVFVSLMLLGLVFRLNTHLELIASVRAFASATSNVLFRIMASYSSCMACSQFFFSGLSIASRYISESPSEPVSVLLSFSGLSIASRYVSGSPFEPVSEFAIIGASNAPRTSAGLL